MEGLLERGMEGVTREYMRAVNRERKELVVVVVVVVGGGDEGGRGGVG